MRSFILSFILALLLLGCASMPINEDDIPDEFTLEVTTSDEYLLVSANSSELHNVLQPAKTRALESLISKIFSYSTITENEYLESNLHNLIFSNPEYLAEYASGNRIYLSLKLPISDYHDFLSLSDRMFEYTSLLNALKESENILSSYVENYEKITNVYIPGLNDDSLLDLEKKVHNQIAQSVNDLSVSMEERKVLISFNRLTAIDADIELAIGNNYNRSYKLKLSGQNYLPEFPTDVYGPIALTIVLTHDFILNRPAETVVFTSEKMQLAYDYRGAKILLLARDQDNAGTDLQENKSVEIAYSRFQAEGFQPEMDGENGFKGQLIINQIGKIDSFEESDDYYIVSVSGRVTVFSVVESDFIADFELKARSIGQSVEAAIDGAFSRFGEKAANRAIELIKEHSL